MKSSSDPDIQLAHTQRGILREEVLNARRRARGKSLYYTEWNTSADSRDPLHDESYAAGFIVKTLRDGHGIADVYSFWTFSDLFEESYFSSVPFHGGFGLLTIHGIAKPSYRAFELLHAVGTELVTPVEGMHPTVDAWVVRGNHGMDVAAPPRRRDTPETARRQQWRARQRLSSMQSTARREALPARHLRRVQQWRVRSSSPGARGLRAVDVADGVIVMVFVVMREVDPPRGRRAGKGCGPVDGGTVDGLATRRSPMAGSRDIADG